MTVSATKIIPFIKHKARSPEACVCKKCGGSHWILTQKVVTIIRTETGTAEVRENVEGEYRCARCRRRATIPDVQAIQASTAGKEVERIYSVPEGGHVAPTD